MKLQQYAVNKQCPTKDGNPNMVWHIRAEFTSFKVLGQNDTYIYLKVEDGITTKINLKGKPLTTSQKKRFGVHDSGMSGPSCRIFYNSIALYCIAFLTFYIAFVDSPHSTATSRIVRPKVIGRRVS